MEILLSEIPPEGLYRSGTFPPEIFDLSPDDSIRPVGTVSYDVTMYLLEDLVAFSGSLRGPFELQCGTCLEYVPFEAEFSNWNSDLELDEGQASFDLAEIVREEFLLELPPHPRCDEILADRTCPKADALAATESEAEAEADGQGSSRVWDALDDLS